MVHRLAPFSDRADRTVVAGQSFGGLASMFAALYWPQRFGCVLSQSGSYWWPHRGGAQTGLLIDRLSRGELHPQGLRIWLEAGIREPIIFAPTRRCSRIWSSRRFSGVRLTAGMMRCAGAAG